MAINKVPSININISFVGAPVTASTDKNVLLIGHRNISVNGDYKPLVPAQNYPALTAYETYFIPAQSTVNGYLNYMQNLGFALEWGESNTLNFSAPSTVTVNSDSSVTLTWSSAQIGYDLLVGANIATTLVQSTSNATGTVSSVSTTSYAITLKNVTGTFNTSNTISVSTINNNLQVPDPTRTDEIVMMVYRYAQAQVLTISSPIVTSAPNLYIAYLNDAFAGTVDEVSDTGFAPNSDEIEIVAPNSVVSLSNGNVALYFTTIPDNFGLVPRSELGNSTITQTQDEDSATGTIIGYLPGLVANGIGLEIDVTEGTFNATDTLTMELDTTQDIFSLLTYPINYVVSPYAVTSSGDLTNPNYAPFFNFLVTGNAASSVNNQQYYAFGVVANISTPSTQASGLPVFDPSSFGAQNIVGAYAPYFPTLGDISFSVAELASFEAGLIARNDIPFNPMNKLATPMPVSSNTKTALKPSDAGTVLNIGWTPYVLNPTTNQLQVVRNVTGLLYYPGTSSPDYNDFPVTNQQIIGLWKKSVYTVLAQPQFTNVRKSNVVKGLALKALQGLATQFEDLGMLLFTNTLNQQFTITDNATDPNAYDVYTPICVSPELNEFNVDTAVISYLNFMVTGA